MLFYFGIYAFCWGLLIENAQTLNNFVYHFDNFFSQFDRPLGFAIQMTRLYSLSLIYSFDTFCGSLEAFFFFAHESFLPSTWLGSNAQMPVFVGLTFGCSLSSKCSLSNIYLLLSLVIDMYEWQQCCKPTNSAVKIQAIENFQFRVSCLSLLFCFTQIFCLDMLWVLTNIFSSFHYRWVS